MSAHFPDPTQIINLVTMDSNDFKIVVMSNKTTTQTMHTTSITETARKLYINPMPQYLNALTIAASKAITDTGATSIFVTEGVKVENKQPVTNSIA